MADVKVPIKFEIYKGDALVREEVLTQDVIKVGKLASSHLRIDDETVSRMHAVIEVTGADEIHIIDLGSTRGTLVNGERVSKTRLQSGDEIMFGDSRVHVTFLEAQQAMTPTPSAPAPRVGQKTSLGIAPPPGGFAPPPGYVPSPPQAQFAAPAAYAAPAGGGGFAPPAGGGGYGGGQMGAGKKEKKKNTTIK